MRSRASPYRCNSMRQFSVDHQWRSLPFAVPHARFGSKADFPWYFEHALHVPILDLEDLCRFLSQCVYVADAHLFGKAEHWQHPADFERIKKGDCEDHALWTWRRLVELGLDAAFMVGARHVGGASSFHAWVVYSDRGVSYLVESVSKHRREIIQPLDAVRHNYTPCFSVNARFRRRLYIGAIALLFKGRAQENA